MSEIPSFQLSGFDSTAHLYVFLTQSDGQDPNVLATPNSPFIYHILEDLWRFILNPRIEELIDAYYSATPSTNDTAIILDSPPTAQLSHVNRPNQPYDPFSRSYFLTFCRMPHLNQTSYPELANYIINFYCILIENIAWSLPKQVTAYAVPPTEKPVAPDSPAQALDQRLHLADYLDPLFNPNRISTQPEEIPSETLAAVNFKCSFDLALALYIDQLNVFITVTNQDGQPLINVDEIDSPATQADPDSRVKSDISEI